MNCIDLFSGAGGFSLAAQIAGLRVRLAIEKDRHAVATYRANLCVGENGPVVMHGDIGAMDPRSIARSIFSSGEACDLLLGGPPCQGFSTHRLRNSGVGDERNELVNVYFSFVHAFRPKAFLMENVPGMLWPRHARHLNSIRIQAAEAGYKLFEPQVIDARDFGIPQRRKRVFILGVTNTVDTVGFDWPPKKSHGIEQGGSIEGNLQPWVSCAAAFAPASENDPNDTHMRHNADLVAAFERTPINGGSRSASGRILNCHREHDGHSDVYGRIDPAQPAPTMTTACINPSKGRFVHPTLPHGITLRQAARIQTFPDDFVFHGGLMAGGAQVGNAVPVKLAVILIHHVASLLSQRADGRPDTARADLVAA